MVYPLTRVQGLSKRVRLYAATRLQASPLITFSLKNVAGLQGCDWLCRNKKVSKFEYHKTAHCEANPNIAANCCASCAAGRGCVRNISPPTEAPPTKAPTKAPSKAPSPSGKGSIKTPSMPSKGKGR